MIFKGLDKRSGAHAVDDGASPESVNTAHYKGVVGHLGPRLGKTFVNAQAFTGRLSVPIPFNLPGATKILLPDIDGNINVVDSPNQGFDEPTSNPFVVSVQHGTHDNLASTTALEVAHPATSGSSSWNTSASYSATNSSRIKLIFDLAASVASPTSGITIAVEGGAIIGGVTRYYDSQSFVLSRYAINSTIVGGGQFVFPQTIQSGNITAMAARVTVTWPSGAAGGDIVTFTPVGLG